MLTSYVMYYACVYLKIESLNAYIYMYVYTHIDPCIKHFYMVKKRE